ERPDPAHDLGAPRDRDLSRPSWPWLVGVEGAALCHPRSEGGLRARVACRRSGEPDLDLDPDLFPLARRTRYAGAEWPWRRLRRTAHPRRVFLGAAGQLSILPVRRSDRR